MATQQERREDPIRQGVGMRLKAVRVKKGLKQREVADRFGVTLATVSAWETGIGDPGIYMLRELSKLYEVSADAILWEDSLTPDAMKFAVEFDSLTEKQKSTFRAVWMAYVREAVTDVEVEKKMPITQAEREPK